MTTDATDVIASIEDAIERAADAMHSAKEWKTEGTYADYIAPVLARTLDHITTLTRERDEARRACALFVEWLDREDKGSGVTHEERGTPEGEARFMEWYMGNIDLCRKSVDAARAVLDAARTADAPTATDVLFPGAA